MNNSNNNSNGQYINAIEAAEPLLNNHHNSESTTIEIDADSSDIGTITIIHNQEERNQLLQRDNSSSNRMDSNIERPSISRSPSTMHRNFLSFFNEARSQFGRQTSFPGTNSMPAQQNRLTERPNYFHTSNNAVPIVTAQRSSIGQINHGASENAITTAASSSSTAQSPTINTQASRSWRMNLNDVFSFSSAPTAEALRSFIQHSSSGRYNNQPEQPRNVLDNNIYVTLNMTPNGQASHSRVEFRNGPVNRANRSNSLLEQLSTIRNNIQQDLGNTNGTNNRSVSSGGSTSLPTTPRVANINAVAPILMDTTNDDASVLRNINGNSGGASGVGSAAAVNGSANVLNRSNSVVGSNGGVNGVGVGQNVAGAAIGGGGVGGGAGAGAGGGGGGGGGGGEYDDENTVITDMVVNTLSHFVRYLPFICILFIKFIYDHLMGIFDLVILHGLLYISNKSVREQIAKFSQKSYAVLFRDFTLVLCVVVFRFTINTSTPDPFGLMMSPPTGSITIHISSITDAGVAANVNDQQEQASKIITDYFTQLTSNSQPTVASTVDPLGNTVTITKAISLGILLYYVAINDLILKLITILIKITITTMPVKVVRHKQRARMFVLVEYISQFYRALAPIHQWLLFLFESYSGLEVISGVLFATFYMSAKVFEFINRGKSLKKSFLSFVRNLDYERKPTNDELNAAGTICPICHDQYTTPVVLECGHIFCDDCVSTWFKREQTCPMCRAKVSEDPTWQDGSTSFFYQLC